MPPFSISRTDVFVKAKGMSRRAFFTDFVIPWVKRSAIVQAFAIFMPSYSPASPLLPPSNPNTYPLRKADEDIPDENVASHQQFLERLKASPSYSENFNSRFKKIMNSALQDCVRNNGEWVVPSNKYADFYSSRDSFWIHAALKNRSYLDIAAHKFHEDQKANSDGHIATALYKDGSRPENRDRDEESTLMDVLREWERKRAGGQPDIDSLNLSYKFILSHVKNGRYITTGETRSGPAFDGDNQVGTYHYWVDTFRPPGRPEATLETIAYNQGLLCVSLRSLQQMGVAVNQTILKQAENTYADMVNPEDGTSLPQREGSTIMDVSSLVGEALSLYYFDKPVLSRERVGSTLNHLTKMNYRDRKFLGFKVISDYNGPYRPAHEYSGTSDNWPGNYQMGGSWLLYDVLALYAGARHGISGTVTLALQRMHSEVRRSASSHEFIRTGGKDLGGSDPVRDKYGWNGFLLNLLP
jgi:hypothetical protein